MFINEVLLNIEKYYNALTLLFPQELKAFLEIFLWSFLVFLYVLLIWKFYHSISCRDIITLNLQQYNRSEHPVIAKLFGALLYFIEYILILPFLVFIWFSLFTLFLILLGENMELSSIIFLSIIIIASIRMSAYHNQAMAKEMAKILPFSLLAVMATNPKIFLNFNSVITQISKIPLFLKNVWVYWVFIILLELLLRVVYTIKIISFKRDSNSQQ